MSITISGYTFEGPYQSKSSLERKSGVYVVLNFDNDVVDVGESGNVRERVEDHEREPCWRRNGGSKYAAHYTDESKRMTIEKQIRREHNPPCGER